MTTNIFSTLSSAKLGLLAQQLAIEVTGQNVANVETEGYSRQDVSFEANTPRGHIKYGGLHQIGTGVRVASIERSHDQFLFTQIMDEGDLTGSTEVKKEIFEQLEVLFNEGSGRSLNDALSSFFSSTHDLATNPKGLPERADLISKAEYLTSTFNQTGKQLFTIQRNIDATIETEVAEINTLTTQIGKLNESIHANEPTSQYKANDLRDNRDRLVKDLSKKIDIQLVQESDNQISLTLKDGTALVLKDQVFSLSTTLNGNNESFKDVHIASGSTTKNITSSIKGGELRGYLDMRDTEVESILDKMNILSGSFIQEFNSIHRKGFGIDGSSGLDFFTPMDVTVKHDVDNTGTTVVKMTNASPTTISVDEFEMEFTGLNSFILNNLTTNASSGTFTFTTGSTFNIKDSFAVSISGAAISGDKVKFSVSENAASLISVSSTITADGQKIAAGTTTSGDGGNALLMANIQNELAFNSVTWSSGNGSFTFDEYYNAIVSTIGIESFSAQATLRQQEGVMLQLNSRRESISGVSIDEEMIKMIKFQQAYNASARMITMVDEMLDTLNRM
ncbi:MAG: flagellar hook-associated protein FlgK [Nitrospina sp.]|jgi:flagellar hook-associated protein 1|nr:flagellar hook-associated protein FlgK [Nitrospina sp.]MBT6600817.1 flagellar hook-associated protein FlgK [Nitrospina sp.]